MEIMAQDSGFVLDEASGLYFHPSSGFYHDANAGWYYNTNDGIYYKFEEGAYVPIAKSKDPEIQRRESEINGVEEKPQSPVLGGEDLSVSDVEHSADPNEAGERNDQIALAAGESSESHQVAKFTSDGTTDETTAEALSGVEVGFPLWHYDSLRSLYWYYDDNTRAYYQYHEGDDHGVIAGEAERFSGITAPSNGNANSGEFRPMQEAAVERSAEDGFEPTTGWVEETLIDLYLKGYPNESTEKDDGPWITSADIFDEESTAYPNDFHSNGNELYQDGSAMGFSYLPATGSEFHGGAVQGQVDDSDNEGSEELEEGEWVPDEPLRIVDGNLPLDDDEAQSQMLDGAGSQPRLENSTLSTDEQDELEEGEIVEEIDGDVMHDDVREVEAAVEESGSTIMPNGQRLEEQWQAQFGQVVREKPKELVVPGAVDLWDWAVVEMDIDSRKPGKPVKRKLVGRIASSVTKLVSVGSGLIRTSAIRAAELDFVKVSSGKVYRLRRPSSKHLNSVTPYDAANPTKDWGFPSLGLSQTDKAEDQNDVETPDQTERRAEALVAKPFVPNTSHWQFQRLVSANAKKAKLIPPALLASKHLSSEEILMNEQRKQKYRDRAAERRTLHGGFGTGPGQKGMTAQEEDKLDAENAVSMEGALKQAGSAPPIGKDNIGKQMLKGMGWKEGQALGVEGGLITPLAAQGNSGRAGLGWS